MEHRIVSLIASSTEIASALGFQEQLVGRSHECDYPAGVSDLPVLTKPRFDAKGSSKEIDLRVKEILKKALSVYEVDGELLKSLAPTVILTQSQCEVCAVSLKDVEKVLREWTGSEARIVSLEPNGLKDIWSDIGKVASALGAEEQGRELVFSLQGLMGAVAAKAGELEARPTVACVEWIDPLMAAGNWMPELVQLAGGTNLFGEAGKHSPWMTFEALAEKDPDAVVVLPCGYDIPKIEAEMGALTRRKGWKELKAVREGRVYLADGNQYFNRPGPRVAESLEILAEMLHPEAFDFGHKGKAWKVFKA